MEIKDIEINLIERYINTEYISKFNVEKLDDVLNIIKTKQDILLDHHYNLLSMYLTYTFSGMSTEEKFRTLFKINQFIGGGQYGGVIDSMVGNKHYAIKYNDREIDTIHELAVGLLCLNNLYPEHCSNFTYYYGYYRCSPGKLVDVGMKKDYTIQQEYRGMCASSGSDINNVSDVDPTIVGVDNISGNDSKTLYSVMEGVNGITLDEFLDENHEIGEVALIVLQIFLAICIAHSKYQFTHYDLSTYNCMVTKSSNSNYYKIDNEYVIVEQEYIPIIIDYGQAYVQYTSSEGEIFDLGYARVLSNGVIRKNEQCWISDVVYLATILKLYPKYIEIGNMLLNLVDKYMINPKQIERYYFGDCIPEDFSLFIRELLDTVQNTYFNDFDKRIYIVDNYDVIDKDKIKIDFTYSDLLFIDSDYINEDELRIGITSLFQDLDYYYKLIKESVKKLNSTFQFYRYLEYFYKYKTLYVDLIKITNKFNYGLEYLDVYKKQYEDVIFTKLSYNDAIFGQRFNNTEKSFLKL